MTLGRRGREPVPRGPREPMASAAPEVEELPSQRVQAGRRSRPPIGLLFGALVVVGILAGGLGILGGGPGDLPRTSELTAIGSHPPTPRAASTPLVVPRATCGTSDRDAVPRIILWVNAIQRQGSVQSIEWLDGRVPPTGGTPLGPETVARLDVRSDVVSIIYTGGDVCAVAWQIALRRENESIDVDTMANPAGDPGIAQQNTFELPLWMWRGSDYDLDVALTFPEVRVRERWPIRILPFEAPRPRLATVRREIPLLDGCDIELHLANGARERPDSCSGDVTGPQTAVTTIAKGAELRFAFDSGWTVVDPFLACGQLFGADFVEDEAATCARDIRVVDDAARFALPSRVGEVTLRIATCAAEDLADAYNELCGTWYGTIRIQP